MPSRDVLQGSLNAAVGRSGFRDRQAAFTVTYHM